MFIFYKIMANIHHQTFSRNCC